MILSKDSVWVCSWWLQSHTHTAECFQVWPYKEGTSCWLPWWLRELKTDRALYLADVKLLLLELLLVFFQELLVLLLNHQLAAAPGRSGAGGPTVCVRGADAAGACGWDATAGTRPPGLGHNTWALGYTADSSQHSALN